MKHDQPTDKGRNPLIGDAWGGLSAMLVAFPAAIAFGVTIFAPLGGAAAAEGALAGLFGAIVLGIVAPLFGGRALIVTAPSAPAAAVLAAFAISLMQQGGNADTVVMQLGLIGFLAGVLQIGLGAAGIGSLIKFIPYPVVSGFLSGVGLIIIGGQIPRFLGAPAGGKLFAVLLDPGLWRWQSIVIGAVVVMVMLLIPRRVRSVPAVIPALLAGIGCYLALGSAGQTPLSAVGNPLLVGLPGSADLDVADVLADRAAVLSGISVQQVIQTLAPALTLAALLSIDTLKTALVVETMTSVRLNANRELIGQGIGNLGSALIGGIAGSGTMGASLVNISAGGRTWRSTLMVGVFSLFAFLALVPLIAWIPVSALAGVLIVLGARMIDQRGLAFFFTPATRLDFVVILSVILVAIFENLVAASGVGVALAILLFIREQTRSSVVRNRIEGHEIFSRHAGIAANPQRIDVDGRGVVVFELQGSLFFGTARQLQSALEPEIESRKFLILSMRRVQSLDVTATHVLELIKDRLEENDAYLVFCDIPKGLPSGLKMKRFLKETGVVGPTNKAFAFRKLDDALEWVEGLQLAGVELAPADDAALGLRAMPALAACHDQAIAALEAAVEHRMVRIGDRVFKSGQDGDALFFVRSGLIKVTVPLHEEDSFHVATCGPGEIIGDMGFVEGSRYGMDASALTDVEVYRLNRARFDELTAQYPELSVALLGNLARGLAAMLHATIGEVRTLRG